MNENPYAAPENPERPDPREFEYGESTDGRRLPPFVSTRTRAMIATGLLVASMLVAVMQSMALFSQAALMQRAAGGAKITIEVARANDSRIQLLTVAALLVFVLCGIGYLTWLYGAHRNLQALGAERLEFSSGGAVGWWFVPIANFVKPYQVMREVWLASNPDFVGDRPWRWRNGSASSLIPSWWLSWLATNILIQIATYGFRGVEKDLTKLGDASSFLAFCDLARMVPGILAITLVWAIVKRQDQAHETLVALVDGSPTGGPLTP